MKKYPKEFKARVALEAVKGEKSIAQMTFPPKTVPLVIRAGVC